MPDMLVKLYDLPPLQDATAPLERDGARIRRALVLEKPLVLAWIQAQWPAWTVEVEAAFARLPVSCFLAQRDNDLLGFACYDGVCRNFFGPTAVIDSARGRGIGPAEYYAKTVGAVLIEGTGTGIYAGRLRGDAER